ncbi:MAG TPA: flagellar hook-associated protein FlgL [Sedimentisphaerales bacterium]|nr:flagellar hook-associated protein FlgL [Sedimentisphaerales bacterium]
MGGILSNVRNNIIYSLSRQTDQLAKLQEQTATGARINRVSDSPSEAYQVLTLDSQVSSLSTYITNLENTVSTLGVSSEVIGSMMSDILSTKTSLTQITGGIYNASQRQIIADKLDSVLQSMISFANTENSGQYLFGGTSTSTAPYLAQYTDGKITSVVYQGSSEERSIELAPGVADCAFYVGDDIFSLDDRGDLSFIGATTGVVQGEGTSSQKGYSWLEISEPVSGTYRLTTDGGKSYVDVAVPPGDSNTKVTNSLTGEVLYLDTTGITGTGVELVNAEGTSDIFNTLITIRDVFNNEKGLPDDQIEQMRLVTLDSIDETYSMLNSASTMIGSKISYLDNTKEMMTDLKYNAEDQTTLIEEADIAQIAIDLTQIETLYQLSLSVAGKMMSMSLFDYI